MTTRKSIQDYWPEAGTFCWGCGKNNEHGLRLVSYWEDDEAVAVWEPQQHHLAFPGVLNGGIIATLIDCHATGTANAAAHKAHGSDTNHIMYVTSSLSVNFIRPTPLERPVTLRAHVTEMSDRKVTVDCELLSDDVLCATGRVVAVRVETLQFLQSS